MVERSRRPRASPACGASPGGRWPACRWPRTLTLALIGLTLVLALIAALRIGNLYSARQDYEDTLARTYELESASSRLLAAGVIEETASSAVGPRRAVRAGRAERAFGEPAANELRARAGRPGQRAPRTRAGAAQRRDGAWRRAPGDREPAAARPGSRAGSTAPGGAGDDLIARQRTRRARARDSVRDDTRTALLVAAVAGGLALLGALALIAALIGSIRRPLDEPRHGHAEARGRATCRSA